MTRVDEFDSFYRSTFAEATQVTYALCGDRQVALEATTDAYRHAWRDWAKIRDRSPVSYVRNEAWRSIAISRGTHLLRRRHEEDSDVALLDALADLDVDERRLIVLMTLGNADLEDASREVGIPAEDGIEQVTTALGTLETSLGQSIAEIERRMVALGAVTRALEVPPPAQIRTAARRGRRRNTLILVAAAIFGVIGAGFVATDDDALATRTALPDREQIGSESVDAVLDARKFTDEDLLTLGQIRPIDPAASWELRDTDEEVENTTPYATCPTERFADPDPLRAFVRTFGTDGDDNARVAQSVEVSDDTTIAKKSYERLIRSFADCEHPRTQLLAAYTVERDGGNYTVLRLVSNRSPERTFTVGFGRSGRVTNTLVHEVDGDTGPDLDAFVDVLDDAVARICQDADGECDISGEIRRASPPRTTEAPDFLGVVDLPPIADVDRVWASTETEADGEPNPAATACDNTAFTGDSVRTAASRVFVLFRATEVPEQFGLTETVGQFADEDAAKTFVDGVRKRIASCADDNRTAEVDQSSEIESRSTSGFTWRVGLEVSEGDRVFYRMGIVRRGSAVAQVLFTPAGRFDITSDVFESVVARAGSRLRYADIADDQG
ncbi:hypothetical protein [Aeromicrobium sp. CF3.5]|uniref:hypothetical protein n=1 Tax=Aeromicrobium sp. CF3.5 TaxID=3373078 RepID=UPI003EE778F1